MITKEVYMFPLRNLHIKKHISIRNKISQLYHISCPYKKSLQYFQIQKSHIFYINIFFAIINFFWVVKQSEVYDEYHLKTRQCNETDELKTILHSLCFKQWYFVPSRI